MMQIETRGSRHLLRKNPLHCVNSNVIHSRIQKRSMNRNYSTVTIFLSQQMIRTFSCIHHKLLFLTAIDRRGVDQNQPPRGSAAELASDLRRSRFVNLLVMKHLHICQPYSKGECCCHSRFEINYTRYGFMESR